MKICKKISGFATILLFLCLLLTGCYSDSYDVDETSALKGNTQVILTFVTPNSSTRSATEDPDGYEAGVEWENYINVSAGDYKIYFFTYAEADEKGGTLIAEFTPDEVTSSSTSSTTTYTIRGTLPRELWSVNDFRVVMLANWGMWYPSVTVGTTTIDDLVEGQYTTFSASTKFTIDENNLIPFYGVQEYTGVTFITGETTKLSTPVSLLRAVAKVEVIFEPLKDQYDQNVFDKFESVSIVNYNSQGYCAPADVYVAADYDTEMKNNPSSGNWSDEWVAGLHLVGGANDTGSKTQSFTQISGATQDIWRIYLPEYNNSGDDYSYISLTVHGEQYNIYFADYTDGETDNTDTSKRYNIKRNNLYRFYVSYKYNHISVWVEKWEECFDNEYTFGETSE